MHCVDKNWRERALRLGLRWGLGGLTALAGCSVAPPAPPVSPPAAPGGAQPSGAAGQGGVVQGRPASPAVPRDAAGAVVLAPPKPVRHAHELRLQAAQRLVAANPGRTYMGEVPAVLLAIPVLEVELRADGSVKHIAVLRRPGQATDTIQLAMDAVYRAAPFGDVSRMPKPWIFSETFLFNDARQFKPRSLDL